jgi:SAM-dependent methyltransferase
MIDPNADAIRAGYAPVARAYREHLYDELAGKPLDRAFLTAFAERCAGPIADVGCGPGHVARYLADRGARVTGVDLSPEMIAEARAAYPDLAFTVGDLFALPAIYPAGDLAGIVAFYAIVHLAPESLTAAFASFRDALAPGGLVALAFHIGTELVHVDALFGCATSLDFRMHDPAQVIASLAAAGLTLEARLDRAPYPDAEHPTQRCYLLARR